MGHEALSKGWAALPRPRVKVTPKEGQVNPVKDLHSGTRFREATLALWSSRLAAQRTESGWKCPRSHGRTSTQGHFCTNGGCLALLESHQAWLKRKLQHLLDLQSWPCSEPRAGPETSRGLPTHLLLQPPVTRPGLPVPTCRYCRYPCTLPDSCWDVSQHTRESSTNKKIAGWCQDFHVSLSKCQKRDSARHRQFVEEPALWGHIQDMPPSLLRAEWETLNHPQDNNSCPPVGSYTMPPALEACKGNPHSLLKGSGPAEEGQKPKRAVQESVDTLSMVLPPTARSMKKVRDPYVGSCAGAAAPEGSADTGLGAAAPWAAADSCVPAAPPASGAGMCSVVSTSIS